jgi:DNA-binding MarR family transcriptional regulator
VEQTTRPGRQAEPGQPIAGDTAAADAAAKDTAAGDIDPDAAELGEQMVRFFRLMAARKRARDESGTGGDGALLAALVRGGPRRATDLAADTFLDLSTVSRQVRSLIERGLVERTPDPDDRRGALLSASASGLAVFESLREQRNRDLSVLLENWTQEDRHELALLMSRLNDEFARRHGAEQAGGETSKTSKESDR